MDRFELRAALANRNMLAFLALIRAGEGTADGDGYRRMFGGELFADFGDHPRKTITAGRYTSTAAGAYQFLSRTWDGLVKQYAFPNFAPACQDEAAVALIAGRGALDDVLAGRIEQAIRRCNREWASLPGSPYGQPTRTMAQALATYAAAGGMLSEAPPLVGLDQNARPDAPAAATAAPQASPAPTPARAQLDAPQPRQSEGLTMPPFLLAALPALIQAIPQLAKLFGSGSEVADRNMAAVQTVAQIVQDATGAKNIQEAVEVIQSDPAALQTATKAVQDNWFALSETGGGIEAARAADVAFVAKGYPVWHSPSFVVAALLIPLVYLVVGAVVGLFGAPFSEDVRAAIANGIVGLILGGLIGYYYGQSTSRNRTPAAGGQQ